MDIISINESVTTIESYHIVFELYNQTYHERKIYLYTCINLITVIDMDDVMTDI